MSYQSSSQSYKYIKCIRIGWGSAHDETHAYMVRQINRPFNSLLKAASLSVGMFRISYCFRLLGNKGATESVDSAAFSSGGSVDSTDYELVLRAQIGATGTSVEAISIVRLFG